MLLESYAGFFSPHFKLKLNILPTFTSTHFFYQNKLRLCILLMEGQFLDFHYHFHLLILSINICFWVLIHPLIDVLDEFSDMFNL